MSRKLEKLVRGKFDLSQPKQRALYRATLVVQNTSKEYAPYDTSALKKSITHDYSMIPSGIGIIGSPLPYARIRHYINYKNPGTIRYFERAFWDNEKTIKKIYKEELGKI